MSTHGVGTGAAGIGRRAAGMRIAVRSATETRPAARTTEFLAFIAMLAAVLVAGLIADNFGAQDVWLYATILTAGYMVSRGLAKSGSFDWEEDRERRPNA